MSTIATTPAFRPWASSAVMAQRIEPRDSLDDFPTPPWGARAWIEHVIGVEQIRGKLLWECAVNRGYLRRGLEGYGATVVGSDIFDYGIGAPVFDFLSLRGDLVGSHPTFLPGTPDWIVTNPPFTAAEAFLEVALPIAREGVAFILRTQIMEGAERYESLFTRYADRWMWSQFVERIPMFKGRVDPKGSSATAYGWLTVFKRPIDPAYVVARRHIPPCRAQLECKGDYA